MSNLPPRLICTQQSEVGATMTPPTVFETAMDYPRARPEEQGPLDLGKGPDILQGPSTNPVVLDVLRRAADAEGIPHQMQAYGKASPTDAACSRSAMAGSLRAFVSSFALHAYPHAEPEETDCDLAGAYHDREYDAGEDGDAGLIWDGREDVGMTS